MKPLKDHSEETHRLLLQKADDAEINLREDVVQPILKAAMEACARLYGHAQISGSYCIVDTRRYKIVERTDIANTERKAIFEDRAKAYDHHHRQQPRF